MVQAEGLNTKEPSAVLETTFANVEYENKIQITLANKSIKVTELPKDQPIPGLLVQSMVAYHTPVEIQKEDIQIMANVTKVVKEAEDSIPGFKQQVANIAIARSVIPNKPTEEQFVNDEILFANMRETYIHACNALRKTGKPYPGKTQRPEEPCPENVKVKLLEQLALSGCDKAYKQKYQDLVMANWDIFSTDRLFKSLFGTLLIDLLGWFSLKTTPTVSTCSRSFVMSMSTELLLLKITLWAILNIFNAFPSSFLYLKT